MPLKNLNPTTTNSWKELQAHYKEVSKVHMKTLFLNDKNRADSFKLRFEELTLDYSKNRVNEQPSLHAYKEHLSNLYLSQSFDEAA